MTTQKRYPHVLFGNQFHFGFIMDASDEVIYLGMTPLRDIPGLIYTHSRDSRAKGKRVTPVLFLDSKAFTFSAVTEVEAVTLDRLVAEVA